MLTKDIIEKLGIIGLLLLVIGWVLKENTELKAELKDARADHAAFVEMVIVQYRLPLTGG